MSKKEPLNIQAYVDVKQIAKIISFMAMQGELNGNSYGSVIHYSFDLLEAYIDKTMPMCQVDTIMEGVAILEKYEFPLAQLRGRQAKIFTSGLKDESRMNEGFVGTYGDVPPERKRQRGNTIDTGLAARPTGQVQVDEITPEYIAEGYRQAGIPLPEEKPDYMRVDTTCVTPDIIEQMKTGGSGFAEIVEDEEK